MSFWGSFREKWKSDHATDQAMTILTLIIAVSTLFVVCFTYHQISLYSESVKIDNRAYLVVQNFVAPKIILGDSVGIPFEIQNLGKTPALKVMELHSFIFAGKMSHVEDSIDRQANNFIGTLERQDNIGIVCGNGAPLEGIINSKRVITEAEARGIINGDASIYVLIFVKYYDFFGERHYTWFCVECDGRGSYRAYKKYNDAD